MILVLALLVLSLFLILLHQTRLADLQLVLDLHPRTLGYKLSDSSATLLYTLPLYYTSLTVDLYVEATLGDLPFFGW